MKNILVVHHAKGVSEAQINSFVDKIPSHLKSEYEIQKQEFPSMPTGLITATPKKIDQMGIDLINKKR